MELLQTKSLLAKLLAMENLHIEQRPVSTASFDTKNRILTIPVLKQGMSTHLYDMFIGHEVGHALHTKESDLTRAYDLGYSMSVMNVLEDARIERKIKQRYPGIRPCFNKAYKELVEDDFFGIKYRDVNQLNFIDRVNMHCKIGAELLIEFNDEEKSILGKIETTETYDDVLEVYKKVADYMKRQKDGENEGEQSNDELDGSDEMETDASDFHKMFSDEKEEESEEDGESDGDGESEEDVESKPTKSKKVTVEDEEKNEDQIDGDGDVLKNKDETDKFEPVSETDNSYHYNETKLFDSQSPNHIYCSLPEVNLDKTIIDHKVLWHAEKFNRLLVKNFKYYFAYSYTEEIDLYIKNANEEYDKFKEETKTIVSYLVKEFELKKNAEQSKRSNVSNSGDLNMNKIFSYKFNEDIFKKMTNVPGGKSHGLIMFIDWSGSMLPHIKNTIKQLLTLTMFCKRVGIPFEVYAFTTNYAQYYPECNSNLISNVNSIKLRDNMNLMNILSSRMTLTEYNLAATRLISIQKIIATQNYLSLHHTPLNEAIVSAMQIVPKFKKDKNLQIVNTIFLTDGEATFDHFYYDNGCVKPIRYNEIVNIRDNVTKQTISVFPPKGGGSVSGPDITNALLKMLKYKTDCNLIGFYLLNSKNLANGLSKILPELFDTNDRTEFLNIKKYFNEYNYKIITSAGYDEYYLIKTDVKNLTKELEIKEDASSRGITSTFKKYISNRTSQKVILNRFIKLIS